MPFYTKIYISREKDQWSARATAAWKMCTKKANSTNRVAKTLKVLSQKTQIEPMYLLNKEGAHRRIQFSA